MPRHNESRERILATATKVFARKGFENATVDEIAQAAGVAKGTVYYSFPTKSALYAGVIIDGVTWLRNEAVAHLERDEPVPTQMLAIIATLTDIFLEYTEIVGEFLSETPHSLDPPDKQRIAHAREEMLDFTSSLVSEGIEHGHLRPVDPRLTAAGIVSMLHALCRDSVRSERPRAREDIVSLVGLMLTTGIMRAPQEAGDGRA